MSIHIEPAKFVTTDGMKFEDEEAAKSHEQLLAAYQRYKQARAETVTAIARISKTRDGYFLPADRNCELFFVDPNCWEGSCELVIVTNHTRLEVQVVEGAARVIIGPFYGDERVYRLDQLFWDKRNAWRQSQSQVIQKICELAQVNLDIFREIKRLDGAT